MLELITITPDFKLVVNMAEVLANTKFAAIMRRVSKMDGDSDGRKKKLNTLEIIFVKLYGDSWYLSSSYGILDKAERVREIKKDIGLPDDWYPDDVVKAAVKEWVYIQSTRNPTLGVLVSLQRGLKSTQNTVEIFNKSTKLAAKKVEELEKAALERDLTPEELKSYEIYNGMLIDNVDRVIKISEKMPKALKSIEELINKIREEQAGTPTARGGKTVGRREDPKL